MTFFVSSASFSYLLVHISFLTLTKQSQFNLYKTNPVINVEQLQFDCLYYYVRQGNRATSELEEHTESNVHMNEYCLRPDDNISVALTPYFLNLRDRNFTFEKLRHSNVTSEQLLAWSSSIDLAERYQLFLNEITINSKLGAEIFYNCSRPWFGSLCQYTFDYRIGMAFVDVVRGMFEDKLDANRDIDVPINNLTCYIHIQCDRGLPLCLDWREICNGRIDCIDGHADEAHCAEIDLKPCAEDEYRCRNGLCIPKAFLRDDPTNPDCLDGTDEELDSSYLHYCQKDQSFRCEELSCPFGEQDFACGDGICVSYYDECLNGRNILLEKRLLSRGHLKQECWLVMVCFTQVTPEVEDSSCQIFKNHTIAIAHLSTCDDIIQFPTVPVAFNHVRFLYYRNHSRIINDNFLKVLHPDFVCYDQELCKSISPTFSHGNFSCLYRHEMNFRDYLHYYDIIVYVETFFQNCSTMNSLGSLKDSSKCISKYQSLVQARDCHSDSHENNEIDYLSLNNPFRQSLQSNAISLVKMYTTFNEISFQKICDGKQDLLPQMINERNHTDETDCEYWPCDNIYTRCNTMWTCPDGRDESRCIKSNCSSNTHPCVSPVNFTLTCLSMNSLTDGIIDCIGATDEPKYCRGPSPVGYSKSRFRCWNESLCLTSKALCDQRQNCKFGDDETFCGNYQNICFEDRIQYRNEIEAVICQLFEIEKHKIDFFSLKTSMTYPSLTKNTSITIKQLPEERVDTQQDLNIRSYNPKVVLRCNRGLNARLWLGGNKHNYRCFCPSSFYGKLCQYQNQRVSLTLQILPVNRYSIYEFVVTLIDHQYQIDSYQQFVYISGWGCHMKFNNYLLYSSRPKDILRNYSVHIDAFDKISMVYYASWYLPIPFPFLPVNRLVAQLHLPVQRAKTAYSCNPKCRNHGRCVKYVNINKFFCKCNNNWSGPACDIRVNSCVDCWPGSICAGSVHNRSICVCPITKYGSRCLLTSCPPNTCQNNGRCVIIDGRLTKKRFSCVCPDSFYGTKCEYNKRRLDISFKNMVTPSYLLLYTIATSNNSNPYIMIKFEKLKRDQRTVSFYVLKEFHMAFIRINQKYYLIAVQEYPDHAISTFIHADRRCPSITELFNATIMNMTYIQRIKYYHLPCLQRVDLWCFFDKDYMCLCTLEHHANCFKLNHSTTFECSDKEYCHNDGLCLQDQRMCPLTKTCICSDCFFGTQCQFYAKGIGLTLDDILRYEIQKDIIFAQQSSSIHLSAILTMLMFVIGMINGVFSYLTFRRPNAQVTGCGLYLSASSITSLFTVILFTLKFWFLVFSQMNLITNRIILRGGCTVIEPLLKALLYTDNWLKACVSIERATTVHRGVKFNQNKSKRIAYWIIIFLPLFVVITLTHEPINRYLFDYEEEQQTWCVIHHSPFLQYYNLVITFFHFLTPSLINLFSALFIIVEIARRHALIRAEMNYQQHLREQFNQHKHTLVSIGILVILQIPRLLISFISDCVESARNPSLFLFGYFISFLPSVLIFAVFVIPSNFYKNEFKKAIKFSSSGH